MVGDSNFKRGLGRQTHHVHGTLCSLPGLALLRSRDKAKAVDFMIEVLLQRKGISSDENVTKGHLACLLRRSACYERIQALLTLP